MTKSEIRTYIQEKKLKMTSNEIKDYSSIITKTLLDTAEYAHCSSLFCYVSFNQEVLTKDIILNSLKVGKKVAVPKIVDDKMIFYYINYFEELKPGTLNILEPITESIAIPNQSEKNLVIVPGVAFDVNKNRIGYGKGFYDGFFMEHSNIPISKIALTYDFQVLRELPTEAHDIKVDQIITQSKILR